MNIYSSCLKETLLTLAYAQHPLAPRPTFPLWLVRFYRWELDFESSILIKTRKKGSYLHFQGGFSGKQGPCSENRLSCGAQTWSPDVDPDWEVVGSPDWGRVHTVLLTQGQTKPSEARGGRKVKGSPKGVGKGGSLDDSAVKGLAGRPDDRAQPLDPTRWQEKVNSRKLSCHLHIHRGMHMPTQISKQTKRARKQQQRALGFPNFKKKESYG